jgi:hypothetical protein
MRDAPTTKARALPLLAKRPESVNIAPLRERRVEMSETFIDADRRLLSYELLLT